MKNFSVILKGIAIAAATGAVAAIAEPSARGALGSDPGSFISVAAGGAVAGLIGWLIRSPREERSAK